MEPSRIKNVPVRYANSIFQQDTMIKALVGSSLFGRANQLYKLSDFSDVCMDLLAHV